MKTVSMLALVTCCSFSCQALAQDIGRYDKKVEQAMLKKAAEKIGPLRGLILTEDGDNFVTLRDLQITPKKETSLNTDIDYFTGHLQSTSVVTDQIVMTHPIDGTDSIVTGRAYKFDSDGNPMNNHQDYPRPTPISVAKSLFEAMQINPYPGSK